MAKSRFNREDIRRGIDSLVMKVSKIGLYVNIIDPYFDGFYITRKSLPLSVILTELIAHVYGQLSRIYFDSSRAYKTASISVIYDELCCVQDKNMLKGYRHLNEFNNVKQKIEEIAINYKSKLELYCDKYYAHSEIRSIEEAKQDQDDFRMSWNEIKLLIEEAKRIIKSMWLYLDDAESDFASNQYEEFRRDFWALIDKSVFENPANQG
jgi:hypothetical protein